MKHGIARASSRRPQRTTAVVFMVLFVHMFSCHTTYADNPLRLVQTTQVSPDSTAMEFNIPAQSLTGALNAFAAVTGLQVSYQADLASGLTSPGVSGTRTKTDALASLLSGTGLEFRFANADTVTLERPSQTPVLSSPPQEQSQGPLLTE